MSRRVLIITYYWPPSGGAGVQRWLKFAKYLQEFGWEPVIYTPENPEVPAEDASLLKDIPEGIEIIKTKIWEPYGFYKKFVGRKKGDKIKTGFLSENKTVSFAEKVSTWIRGNLFIPDARKYWIKPSVKFLSAYLEKNPVEAIISTGPPHSMHMIALGVSKKLNIPWLADFRDPWTKIDFYHQLMLSRASDRLHHKMEKQVLLNADKLVTVSWNWAKDFEDLGAKNMEVVTNGYDPDDFEGLTYERNDKFEFVHLGSMNKDRNQQRFWESLSELLREISNLKSYLKITLIGQLDYSVNASIEKYNLSEFVNKIAYMPHREVIKIASNADVLFLPLNNTPHVSGIVPGKIFEYLAMKRPILCIGPEDGDSARIIEQCNAGKTVGFENKENMKVVISDYFDNYLSNSLRLDSTDQIAQFSRKRLAGEIAKLLNEITRA
jgi:glycosyltransferase involved in cell wall biosynthesis